MSMPMPAPTEEHTVLASLAGDWQGVETVHPGPYAAAGFTAQARVSNRVALGGFAVIQDYAQYREGKLGFEGHGVFSFDAESGYYQLHWWDNFGTPTLWKGSHAAGIFSLTTNSPEGGALRCSIDVGEAGHYRYKMEISPDGQHYSSFMDGHYTRA